MSIGLLAKKLGMTHVYDDFGRRIAVTVLKAGPCTVTSVREPQRDGYHAIQVGFETAPSSKLTKPQQGQVKGIEGGPFRYLREFRLALPSTQGNVEEAANTFSVGQRLTVDVFQDNELVDVTGVSIGKGFQGGVKRWNWRGGSQTHGSMSHRAPGSIGSTTTPGRVFRGHHLPGHMGAARVTVQNLRIIQRDPEHDLLVVQGALPGPRLGVVMVRKSQKFPGRIKAPLQVQMVVEEEEETSKKAKAKKK